MDENSIKNALELLQIAQTILDSAFLAESTSDGAAIAMAREDLDKAIEAVGELIGLPAGTLNDEIAPYRRTEEMTTELETIRNEAQWALSSLSDKRPGDALANLKVVLKHLVPDSPDVEVIGRVTDQLEKVVCEITEVEDLLNKTNFTFGNIKALLETPVEVPWGSDGVPWDDDPPRLN